MMPKNIKKCDADLATKRIRVVTIIAVFSFILTLIFITPKINNWKKINNDMQKINDKIQSDIDALKPID